MSRLVKNRAAAFVAEQVKQRDDEERAAARARAKAEELRSFVMDFGKWRGTPISNVHEDYLLWMCCEGTRHRKYAVAELQRRGLRVPSVGDAPPPKDGVPDEWEDALDAMDDWPGDWGDKT